jgi:OmcA/MtrC family decaheme c-type cytochrome
VATGFSGRRDIVEDKRCNACHQELGTFTEEAFHGGQRNDGTTCSWCHTPNRASYGWSADSTNFVHAIHGAAKRTVDYNWHNIDYFEIGYPGILSDCETCHKPGTYDFSATATADAADFRLYRLTASGTPSTPMSPYVTATNYGTNFSFSAGTGVTTEAAATTLVSSPTVAVCSACHDSNEAIAHFRANNGSFYAPRSSALAATETCLVCHASGRIADIKVMHSKNR